MKRALISVAVVAVISGGVAYVAHAAATVTASCTPSPAVVNANDGTAQKITVVCKVPKPPPSTVTARPTATATVTVTQAVTATATVSPSSTPTVTPTPTPTSTPTPTQPPDDVPQPGDFPTATSVGPDVEPTQTYAGDCTFDASESGLVVENRIVNCAADGLRFAENTSGIVFRDSVIRGQMLTVGNTPGDPGADQSRGPVFTVESSRIIQSQTGNAQDRAACCAHFVIRDSLVQGTHSGLAAHSNVVLEGNYITSDGTDSHSSGGRILRNTVVRGNTFVCKPVTPGHDGGCSAPAVFYREALTGEGAAAFNLTIERNYFKQGVTASGQPGGAWYATRFAGCDTANDCVNIRFTGNLFDRGWGTDAGEFPNDAGDVWADNWWVDGQPALSNTSR